MRLRLTIKNWFAPRAGHARPGPQSQYETSRSSLDSPNFTGGSSKFSRIAAPLTLILKTSSTESAELRKGVVGVGGGSRNRAEPVGKHEFDGFDAGGGTGGKSVKKSSKSRRIVKESKSFKGLKNLQRPSVRRNVYRSTGPLSTKNSSFR